MSRQIFPSVSIAGAISIIAVSVLLLISGGEAATFGSLEGRVVDASTMTPVTGATVALSGPRRQLEAVTDSLGEYVITGLVAGGYRLVITADGYDSLVVSDFPAVAGLVQFRRDALKPIGEPMGATERSYDFAGGEIHDRGDYHRLPVRTVEGVVALEPAVVSWRPNNRRLYGPSSGREALNSPELYIRGGRVDENAFMVNGMDMTDPISGQFTATIGRQAIDQVSVLAAGVPVGYGGAPSIVDVRTRAGTSEYTGLVEVVSDNTVGSDYDQNWYTVQLNGPIPLVDRGYFTGTMERRWLGDRNPSPGADVLPGSPKRLPNNWQSGWSYHGRADYRFTDDLAATATFDMTTDEWSEYRHAYYFNIEHTPRYKDDNLNLNGRLTHHLGDATAFSVRAGLFKSERMSGDGVVFDDLPNYVRRYVWPDSEVDDIVNPDFMDFDLFYTPGEPVWVDNLDTVVNGTDTTFVLDSVLLSIPNYWDSYYHHKSSTIEFSGEVRHKVDEHHTLTAGIEYRRSSLRSFENLAAARGYDEIRVNACGFDTLGRVSDDEDWRRGAKHPTRMSLHVSEDSRYRAFRSSIGVRMERYDFDALALRHPLNPYQYGVPGVLDREDLVETESVTRWSVRYSASALLKDFGLLYIDLDLRHKMPPARYMYVDWGFFEERVTAGSFYPFGLAQFMVPQRTRSVQAGLVVRPLSGTEIHVLAFQRYLDDQVSLGTFDSVDASIRTYTVYTTGPSARARGADFMVSQQLWRNLKVRGSFSLSDTKGLSSYAGSAYVINWSNPSGIPRQESPLDWEQGEKLVGVMDLAYREGEGPLIGEVRPLENFRMTVAVTSGSGLPYTPTNMYDAATEAAARPSPAAPYNSAETDWTTTVDLKAERSFQFYGLTVTPFLWIKNLLNAENVTNMWETSGAPDNTGYLETEPGKTNIQNYPDPDETGLTYEQKYRLKEADPQNYGSPRQIYFGLRTEF